MVPLEATRTSLAGYWRVGVVLLVPVVLLAGIMSVEPIPQDLAYHQFADRRSVLGVPNFANVASNVLFLLVGLAGIALCAGRSRPPSTASWMVLFVGTALVAAGSAYYHWRPDNASLVWDRLPMTLGFMGLFVALMSEHIAQRLEKALLIPALAVGAASVAWWHFADDLRLYAWVQFMPLAAIALVLALFPARYTHRNLLLYALGLYAFAKAAEFWDREIFTLTAHALSGHSAKHLLAGLALGCVYLMLRWRVPIAAPPADDSSAAAGGNPPDKTRDPR